MRRLNRRHVVLGAGALLIVGAVVLKLVLPSGNAAECALLYDREARLACRARLGLDAAGDMDDLRALVDATKDPTERDLLLLRLVMDDPRRGRWACPEVVDPKLAAWCLDVKGRTHLAPTGPGG